MKFNCGLTEVERKNALREWHDWFAWFPVNLGKGDCRWLEVIERKGDFYGVYHDWYYRSK